MNKSKWKHTLIKGFRISPSLLAMVESVLGIHSARSRGYHETRQISGHLGIGNARRFGTEINLPKIDGFHWEIDARLKDEPVKALFMQQKPPLIPHQLRI